MAFTAKDWKDYPDTSTPITAAALEDLETRVVAAGLNAITATGKKIAWGSASTPNYNSSTVPTYNIEHGLGGTPVFAIAVAGSVNNGSIQIPVTVSVDALTSTEVGFRFYAGGYSGTNFSTFYWIAIG